MGPTTLSEILLAMSQMGGLKDPIKRRTKKLGHEPTSQEKRRFLNKQRVLIERKLKKRRKEAANQRKINRLRGVGI